MRAFCSGAVACFAAVAMGIAGCGASSNGEGDSAGADPATASINGSASSNSAADKKQEPESVQPTVVIDTSLGEITVELDNEKAPLTVAHFLYYAERGFFDQTVFHQAIDGEVVLGGGYTADLAPKEARVSVRSEADKGLKNNRHTIALVRRPDDPHSATSMFYFNLADNPHLDHAGDSPEKYGYCAFGRVVDGHDVVDKIGSVPVEDTAEFPMKPVKTVLINSVRRVR